MREFLKSIFFSKPSKKVAGTEGIAVAVAPGESPARLDASQAPVTTQGEAVDVKRPSNVDAQPGNSTLEEILADLVIQISATMPDPRSPEEIDTRIHMYDAGYVTSITAADLLAHIDGRYRVDISETKLIGPLQNLEALASYIHSQSM